MRDQEFNESITNTLGFSQKMLTQKSSGYSTSDDRLHNFRTAAALNDSTMEQALWGMLTKHIVSLRDMVKTGHAYSTDIWDEKIGDAINYLAILRAIVSETGRKPEPVPNQIGIGIEASTPVTGTTKFITNQQRDIDAIRRVADKHSH